MKKFFYPRLAATGIRKNGKTYVPYLMTCIGMVMVSYLLFFLMNSERVAAMKGGSVLQEMLTLGSGIFSIFSLIFLFYTNSFLVRRRKQEFGLYNILGMDKKNLARILFWESVIMAAISFGGGLLLGILFSKLAELCMAKVLGGNVGFGFSVEMSAIWRTLSIFAGIFVLVLLNSLRQVGLSRPIELLRGGTVGEKPPKGNWLFAAAGVVLLAAAYYIAVTIQNPLAAILGFFVAVLLVIVATYLLFIAGSVVLCRILKKNKSYYYKEQHFVSVSSMMYRMKRNGAGLASICILSTMVLVMVSATMCLYVGKEAALHQRFPRELQLEIYSADSVKTAPVWQIVEEEMAEAGREIENLQNYRYLEITALSKSSQMILDRTSVEAQMMDVSDLRTLLFFTLEDYNRLSGTQETLEADEILVSCNREGSYDYDTLELENCGTFRVKNRVPEFVQSPVASYMITSTLFIVVPDMEQFNRADEAQKSTFQDYASWAKSYYGWDMGGSDEEQIEMEQRILDRVIQWHDENRDGPSILIDSIAGEWSGFYGVYGGLFVLGILLGSVFLLATVLIMYYKQITEGYEDQSRFEVMRKVGMSRRSIRKSINSQMLTVFLLPLLLAAMHVAFAFPVVRKLLLMFGLTDQALLIKVTAGCLLVFALFYALVYRMTSRAYYKIVGGGKEEV